MARIGARRLALILILGSRLLPTRVLHATPSVCPVRALTGRPCPTCGLTRSWHAATRLRLSESLDYHPLGPLTLLAAAALAVADDGDASEWARAHRPEIAAMAGAWLATWLARVRQAGAAIESRPR